MSHAVHAEVARACNCATVRSSSSLPRSDALTTFCTIICIVFTASSTTSARLLASPSGSTFALRWSSSKMTRTPRVHHSSPASFKMLVISSFCLSCQSSTGLHSSLVSTAALLVSFKDSKVLSAMSTHFSSLPTLVPSPMLEARILTSRSIPATTRSLSTRRAAARFFSLCPSTTSSALSPPPTPTLRISETPSTNRHLC
mmetsp:Transcript_25353/g.52681  ORF Transcript_25353/g.52681 Transcript_25353/m.52681 type:complete len:200 (-) Transcript_25353:1494-2093(-)